MLAIEGLSVAAIVLLSIVVLAHGGAHGISASPFTARNTTLAGLGLATVFSLLSFAGFEGAASLGAESREPTRTIPLAIASSVALAGVLYIFVAYAQSIGFGLDAHGVAAFAASASPLGDLAARYASVPVAALIMGGAAISAFAATIAPATGAARLLYTFAGEARVSRRFAHVDARSGTPAFAYLVVLAIGAAIVIACAVGRMSGTDAFAATGTAAVLALVLVYGAVQIAALRLFGARWRPLERAIPVVALISLVATFLANVFPVPHGLAALYPYLVLAWLALGVLVLRDRALVPKSRAEDPQQT
jgi:amino acid transporter